LQTLVEVAREKSLIVVTETGGRFVGEIVATEKAVREYEKRSGSQGT